VVRLQRREGRRDSAVDTCMFGAFA